MPPRSQRNIQYASPAVPSFLQKLHAQVNGGSGEQGQHRRGVVEMEDGKRVRGTCGGADGGEVQWDDTFAVKADDDDEDDDGESEEEWDGAQVVVLKEGRHLTEEDIKRFKKGPQQQQQQQQRQGQSERGQRTVRHRTRHRDDCGLLTYIYMSSLSYPPFDLDVIHLVPHSPSTPSITPSTAIPPPPAASSSSAPSSKRPRRQPILSTESEEIPLLPLQPPSINLKKRRRTAHTEDPLGPVRDLIQIDRLANVGRSSTSSSSLSSSAATATATTTATAESKEERQSAKDRKRREVQREKKKRGKGLSFEFQD